MKSFIFWLFCCFSVWGSTEQVDSAQSIYGSVSFSEKLGKLKISDSYRLDEIIIGDKRAPYTVIVYLSFSCHLCRKFFQEELPKLQKKYINQGKVKLILRNYLDDMASLEAAVLMRIFSKTSQQAVIWHKKIFDVQKSWKDSPDPQKFLIRIFAKSKKGQKAVSKLLNPKNETYQKTLAGLMKEQQRAMHKFRILSAPAFVINGNVHQGTLKCDEIVERLKIPE